MNGYRVGGYGMLPSVIKSLILVNAVAFLVQQLFSGVVTYYFGMVPQLFWKGFIWQPVTYMFMHGNFMHIFFNMFVLWMFGRILVDFWGPKKFLKYYMICGIGAGIFNALLTPGSPIPIVGASGAIYGLLLAFGVLFPNQMIYIYFLFPIRAKYFVIGLAVIEFFTGFSAASPVAHFAHFGGMLVGFAYIKWPRLRMKFRQKKTEMDREKNLRVVYNRREEVEKLQKEVDELLDKINRDGLDALSNAERNRLREASQKLKEWEEEGFPRH